MGKKCQCCGLEHNYKRDNDPSMRLFRAGMIANAKKKEEAGIFFCISCADGTVQAPARGCGGAQYPRRAPSLGSSSDEDDFEVPSPLTPLTPHPRARMPLPPHRARACPPSPPAPPSPPPLCVCPLPNSPNSPNSSQLLLSQSPGLPRCLPRCGRGQERSSRRQWRATSRRATSRRGRTC